MVIVSSPRKEDGNRRRARVRCLVLLVPAAVSSVLVGVPVLVFLRTGTLLPPSAVVAPPSNRPIARQLWTQQLRDESPEPPLSKSSLRRTGTAPSKGGRRSEKNGDDGERNIREKGFAWTNYPAFRVTDFPVAGGVNLAEFNYNMSRNNKNPSAGPPGSPSSPAGREEENHPPFELFEDFSLEDKVPLVLRREKRAGRSSPTIKTWEKMLDWRDFIHRPEMVFYMDKVAQKSYLARRGVPTPRTSAALYRGELNATARTVEAEAEAIYRLLPPAGGGEESDDFVAKATHFGFAKSVNIVARDKRTGKVRLSQARRNMTAPGKSDRVMAGIGPSEDDGVALRRMVATNIAKMLPKRNNGSWGLQNTRPGVLVEERFVLPDDFADDTPAMEFKVISVWGKAVAALWRRGLMNPGCVLRDGTVLKQEWEREPFRTTSLPHWLDWDRVIDIAEELSTNKDMFRVDIFVGVPATSPVLRRPGGRMDEKMKALQYVVSESDVRPLSALPDEIYAEIARLWIAGYRIGNYRLVNNTEVSEEFWERGKATNEPDIKPEDDTILSMRQNFKLWAELYGPGFESDSSDE